MSRKKRRKKSQKRKRTARRRSERQNAEREFVPGPAPRVWHEIMEVFESLDSDDLEGSAERELGVVKSDLVEALAPFDAFDILTNLAMSNTPLNPDSYRESEFEGLTAGVELAEALLVERGRPGSESEHPAIDAIVLDHVNELVRRALRLMSIKRLGALKTEASGGDDTDDGMGGLRHSMLSRELFLRNPAFADQEIRTIRGIFDRPHVDKDLREAVGFAADDALTLMNRVIERTGDVLSGGAARLRQDAEVVMDFYDTWRSGASDVPGVLVSLFEAVGNVPPRVARRRIVETGVMGYWAQVGDALSFTASTLAEEVDLPEAVTEAFLEWYSLGFHDLESSDWEAAAQMVRNRPLIRDDDGEYFLTVPGNLLWSIRSRLEDAVKPTANPAANDRQWNRFERARSSYVEDSVLDLLEQALAPVSTFRNLEYESDGEWYEADGLLLIDTFAIVVEAKAGALTPPTKRAAPKRMKKDLGKLLDHGAAQAERLRGLVAGGQELKIRRGGVEEKVDVESVRHVFPVVVTLEDLGPFAIALWDLQRVGIIDEDRYLPWATCIHDLEIICDLVDFPAQLLHYLIRRSALNTLERFRAFDELDLWMYYLDTGLYEEGTFSGPNAPDLAALASQTDDLDAYYLWKSGARSKKAKKPVQKMHNQFRRMLDHLDSERPGGFMDASVALLNMAHRERQLVASRITSMKKDSASRDRFRDMTLQFTGSIGSADIRYGLTWMTGPPGRLGELETRLDLYCQAKKHQLRADAWFGFAVVDRQPGPFQYYMWGSFPWEDDEELDRLVENMGLVETEAEEE
ncbi:MAG TPA: hypothetical protein ENH00_09580 [Actinobacteria bacterium]|nr:hypothetical protein [Actinomycetota bacterium]